MDNPLTEEQFNEVMKHLDVACTMMKMCILPLHDVDDPDKIQGFILAPMEYFTGELDLDESEGVWQATRDKPEDPKKLN